MEKKFLIPLIIVFAVFFIQKNVYAKSYSYPDITIYLDFKKDGTVTVRQERTYDFQGNFSWAYLDLLKKGVDDIKFVEIRDMETNQSILFNIEDDSRHVKATWYYSANYEWKKFLIVYKIYGAVYRYQDVAEFYWKVIENEHEFIKDFNAVITLPEPSPNLLKLFVHSSAKLGEMHFSDDFKQATVIMHDIPKDTFVEFRLLTDPSIFSEVRPNPKNMYQNILDDEKNVFVVGSIQNFTNTIFFYIILTIFPLVIFFYFYFKYGIEPKVEYDLTYEHEPPNKIPPMALASSCSSSGFSGKTNTQGFIATIFDLARRGYLEIREEIRPHFLLFEKKEQIFTITNKGKKELDSDKPELLNFELLVLRFLFQIVPNKESIDIPFSISKLIRKINKDFASTDDADIQIENKTISPEVTASDVVKWNREKRNGLEFINLLGVKARIWFESNFFSIFNKKSMVKSRLFLKIVAVYLVGVFVLLFFLGKMSFVLFFYGGLIAFLLITIGMIPILQKTPEATLEIKKWKAFKRFISDFSAMKDAPATLLHIWDEYLVYAVVLGVAKELLKNLERLAKEYNWKFAAVTWYTGTGVARMPSGAMSPESFSSLIGNMSNMISALSSSSSVGGGFAGGGGGGGGGGGSGAG